jgi:TPP-dependent pyruvate/acetoin dehydrogenase alpha subunit
MNAAGVLQIPLAIFIWDDGYGISVPKKIPNHEGIHFGCAEWHAKRGRHQWP